MPQKEEKTRKAELQKRTFSAADFKCRENEIWIDEYVCSSFLVKPFPKEVLLKVPGKYRIRITGKGKFRFVPEAALDELVQKAWSIQTKEERAKFHEEEPGAIDIHVDHELAAVPFSLSNFTPLNSIGKVATLLYAIDKQNVKWSETLYDQIYASTFKGNPRDYFVYHTKKLLYARRYVSQLYTRTPTNKSSATTRQSELSVRRMAQKREIQDLQGSEEEKVLMILTGKTPVVRAALKEPVSKRFPTSYTIDEIVRGRSARVWDIECSHCAAHVRMGWRYFTPDKREYYLCSVCKAKLANGKMNYSRQVVKRKGSDI